MTCLQLLCFVIVAARAAVADVVEHTPCHEYPQNLCTIERVRIDPCITSKYHRNPCKLHKTSPANISFDFTPNFSASKLKTGFFWEIGSSYSEVPIGYQYEFDGCQLTSCPIVGGESQKFTHTLKLRKWHTGKHVFKWKLWNKDDDSQVCCFKTDLKFR